MHENPPTVCHRSVCGAACSGGRSIGRSEKRFLALYYILKQSKRQITEFDALPDVERRVARGDYDFFSSVDVELWELVQEAQRNGFILAWNWDGQDIVYTCEQMSPEDHAAFLAEEQEILLEDLKWRSSQELIEP